MSLNGVHGIAPGNTRRLTMRRASGRSGDELQCRPASAPRRLPPTMVRRCAHQQYSLHDALNHRKQGLQTVWLVQKSGYFRTAYFFIDLVF